MKRKIIKIDEEKCNGCGACATSCHEGAIEIIQGKAKLVREDHCDGLGDCLPACPMNAISFEEREAPSYNEAAVLATKRKKEEKLPCGCPGMLSRVIRQENANEIPNTVEVKSYLSNFPVQIKLAPVQAHYFHQAKLLIAADCTAYAYGNFHAEFIRNHTTLIGCPKLDAVDYAEKLTAILQRNEIQSITVTRMEVPCCSGLENAVKRALLASGKNIPLRVVTISANGNILRS